MMGQRDGRMECTLNFIFYASLTLHASCPLCHRASLSGFCFKHETTLVGLPLGFLVLVHISFDPRCSFTHSVQESGQLSVFGQLQRSSANDAMQILSTI